MITLITVNAPKVRAMMTHRAVRFGFFRRKSTRSKRRIRHTSTKRYREYSHGAFRSTASASIVKLMTTSIVRQLITAARLIFRRIRPYTARAISAVPRNSRKNGIMSSARASPAFREYRNTQGYRQVVTTASTPGSTAPRPFFSCAMICLLLVPGSGAASLVVKGSAGIPDSDNILFILSQIPDNSTANFSLHAFPRVGESARS